MCDRVDTRKYDDDGMEGLRHLAFGEIEGERDIRESPLMESAHLLLMKLMKQNFGSEDKSKIALVGDY